MNLPDLFQSYGVDVRQQGQKYWSICPFHDDKSPSMTIREHQGKWKFHCFGCGEKGDAIDFVMKMDRCSFFQAKAKLGIPDDLDRRQSRRDRKDQKDFVIWRRQLAHGLHLLIGTIESSLDSVIDDDDLPNLHAMLVKYQQTVHVLQTDDEGALSLYRGNRMQPIADYARVDYERRLT